MLVYWFAGLWADRFLQDLTKQRNNKTWNLVSSWRPTDRSSAWLGRGTLVPVVKAAGFSHMMQSSHGKTFVVGDYMTRERSLRIGERPTEDFKKGDPVKDYLIHPHHECRRNDKFAILVIDLVHCLSHRMGFRSKR
jgi:hypothetical protein